MSILSDELDMTRIRHERHAAALGATLLDDLPVVQRGLPSGVGTAPDAQRHDRERRFRRWLLARQRS